MSNRGFPVEQDLMSPRSNVFSFPVQAPKVSVTVKQTGAMEQLRLWKTYQNYWCEHKPSITIYYTDDEFFQVAQWIWENFDICSGISLLPYSDHVYQQAPYEEINKKQYTEMLKTMFKNVDWVNELKVLRMRIILSVLKKLGFALEVLRNCLMLIPYGILNVLYVIFVLVLRLQ